jgi:DNA polymerase-3 subunit gamma/tau
MEEPPAYVKFILATTEIEKVPETIRSRAQRFDFRKISREDIVKQLQYICGLEHIQAEEKALSTIARVAKGGMRDAITLLEQNIVEKQVTFDHVRNAMSLVDEDILGLVIQILVSGDREKLKNMLTKMQSQHIDVRMYMEELLYTLRDRIFAESDAYTLSRYMHIFSHIEK